jgi:hypothetical protein
MSADWRLRSVDEQRSKWPRVALIGPLPGRLYLAGMAGRGDGLVATRCAIVAICSSGRHSTEPTVQLLAAAPDNRSRVALASIHVPSVPFIELSNLSLIGRNGCHFLFVNCL